MFPHEQSDRRAFAGGGGHLFGGANPNLKNVCCGDNRGTSKRRKR